MGRYVKDLPTGLSRDQAWAVIDEYLRSEGLNYVDERGEMVWKKGLGLATIPQFLKAEPLDNMVHIEAWVSSISVVPGVYGGEQDLTGVWGWAIKSALKSRVNTLESRLTGAAPVAAVAAGASAPAAGAPRTPAGWLDDPTGRHQHRYWDGVQWTADVADGGAQSSDPV